MSVTPRRPPVVGASPAVGPMSLSGRRGQVPARKHAIGCGHERERRRPGRRPLGRLPARHDQAPAVPRGAIRPGSGLGALPARLRWARPHAEGPAARHAAARTPVVLRQPASRTPSATACAHPRSPPTGRPSRKARYLRPLFSNEEIWCQLFSEPGAGSDVAGLATRAERDGDEWLLNGQKVWTTLAHISSFGLIIARTNPDAPKHKGMTAFLVDMKAPGVDVRPLFQITGEAEFNEVFFTDVRMPDSARIGDEGEGWGVAVTTLMNERVSIGGAVTRRGGGLVGEAMRIWKERWQGDTSPHALALRDRLMSSYIRGEVYSMTNLRAAADSAGRNSGTRGFGGQAGHGRGEQARHRTLHRPARSRGHALPCRLPHGATRPGRNRLAGRAQAVPAHAGQLHRRRHLRGHAQHLWASASSGLPGDVRTDKGLPWKDIPRS